MASSRDCKTQGALARKSGHLPLSLKARKPLNSEKLNAPCSTRSRAGRIVYAANKQTLESLRRRESDAFERLQELVGRLDRKPAVLNRKGQCCSKKALA
jgi:hypothetical protein